MRKPKPDRAGADGLTDAERRDILLWFGWGAMLGYDTSPIGYLREAMKSDNKKLFLAMPRTQRKAILRFVITEHSRRCKLDAAPAPRA